MSMRKKSTKNNFYFDDCVVCRAMKTADENGRDLSLTELRGVFAKANKKKNSETKSAVPRRRS